MYSFTPNGRRRGLHAVVIVDLAASVLLWTSATAGGSYGWIFQLAGVVLAVLGIYLITRYSLRSYTFSVQDSELVDSAVAGGHRVLVFSQYTSMLKFIRETLLQKGFDSFYLDGSTPPQRSQTMWWWWSRSGRAAS